MSAVAAACVQQSARGTVVGPSRAEPSLLQGPGSLHAGAVRCSWGRESGGEGLGSWIQLRGGGSNEEGGGREINGTVTTASLGAPLRIPDRTSQFIEFDVPENSDTASGDVNATVSLPADIDLFLQRQLTGDSWSADLFSGGSASPTGEVMKIDTPLQPGKYRIEVHNFAGPPGNTVTVNAVFYDSAGNPGA